MRRWFAQESCHGCVPSVVCIIDIIVCIIDIITVIGAVRVCSLFNPIKAAVPFWGQNHTPKRDWSSKWVEGVHCMLIIANIDFWTVRFVTTGWCFFFVVRVGASPWVGVANPTRKTGLESQKMGWRRTCMLLIANIDFRTARFCNRCLMFFCFCFLRGIPGIRVGTWAWVGVAHVFTAQDYTRREVWLIPCGVDSEFY